MNDFFTIFGEDNIETITNLNIYNRWGGQVFAAENIDPNDELQGWDGRRKGEILNPGVYIYSAQILFSDGEMRSFEGDFTLIR